MKSVMEIGINNSTGIANKSGSGILPRCGRGGRRARDREVAPSLDVALEFWRLAFRMVIPTLIFLQDTSPPRR
ncbi:hypothetical protein EVAR_16013_1 [Eumeta japonica]|uniref:Uncharacterized protein n=1 Tax=Eumeta variegata TaxID=151549 RepID=A0A4C1VYW6_EUMVA|nr:hypothetical protein EVAR_16013_1 [Eumeta japonica]